MLLAPAHAVQVLTIGEFRFGLCHGHQVVPWGDLDSLAMLSRQLDVDGARPRRVGSRAPDAPHAVLITGHTHEFKAYKYEERLFINPGSATGAYSALRATTRPSFVLMDVDGQRVRRPAARAAAAAHAPQLVAYVYQLVDGEVKVDKVRLPRCAGRVSLAPARSDRIPEGTAGGVSQPGADACAAA